MRRAAGGGGDVCEKLRVETVKSSAWIAVFGSVSIRLTGSQRYQTPIQIAASEAIADGVDC